MFVQVIQGHTAEVDELRSAFDQWVDQLSDGATGWLGSTGGVTDDGTFIGLARFESPEAARRNSDRPEQHQWWMETSKLFAGDVHFHDCPQAMIWLRGGSNDAGFVQFIQGRVADPERLEELSKQTDTQLQAVRPDIIGGVVAVHGDEAFTEAVYFTSEAEARKGERTKLPEPLASAFEEEMALMRDVRYLDLRDPWLYSPHSAATGR